MMAAHGGPYLTGVCRRLLLVSWASGMHIPFRLRGKAPLGPTAGAIEQSAVDVNVLLSLLIN